jgi:hypoxanthine phosphoribosyltransferase
MLADKIREHNEPEAVVGIAHGGVIVGATIASLLGRDMFPIKFSRRVDARVVRKQSKLIVPPTADLAGKQVLVVDDASRSGDTMRAALEAIRGHRPSKITTAVLIRRGQYEPDFAGSYFAGEVKFPWQMEEGLPPSEGPSQR